MPRQPPQKGKECQEDEEKKKPPPVSVTIEHAGEPHAFFWRGAAKDPDVGVGGQTLDFLEFVVKTPDNNGSAWAFDAVENQNLHKFSYRPLILPCT